MDKTARLQPGDSRDHVLNLLGTPGDRSFNGNREAMQYCSTGWTNDKYVIVWLQDGVVAGITTYNRSDAMGICTQTFSSINWAMMPREESTRPSQSPKKNDVKPVVSGTCFFVTQSGEAMTNNHVIVGRSKLKVIDANGISHEASVTKIDPANDLALLSVRNRVGEFLSFGRFGGLNIGDPIFTMGYPALEILGSEVKYTDGAVSSLTGIGGVSNLFQMTVPIQPGNSGGPVLSENGQVVGVVIATAAVERFFKATGSFPQNVNWAIKSEYAAILSEQSPERRSFDSRQAMLAHVKDSVCLVVAE